MADTILGNINLSKLVQGATKGRLQTVSVWRDGVAHPTDGALQTSTVGGRATIIHQPILDRIEQPMAGDEFTVQGDQRRWRILSVSGVPGTAWEADLARGLKAGQDSYAPVEMSVASFSTYVLLTVLPPAVLARGHILLIEWDGPTQGSLYTSRGIVQVMGLLPESSYTFKLTEFTGDGEPSTTQEFTARTTQ